MATYGDTETCAKSLNISESRRHASEVANTQWVETIEWCILGKKKRITEYAPKFPQLSESSKKWTSLRIPAAMEAWWGQNWPASLQNTISEVVMSDKDSQKKSNLYPGHAATDMA